MGDASRRDEGSVDRRLPRSQGDQHIDISSARRTPKLATNVRGDVRKGVHTAPSKSATVAEAAEELDQAHRG